MISFCHTMVLWGFFQFQHRWCFPHRLFQRHGGHLEESTVHVACSPSSNSSSSAQHTIYRCHGNRLLLGRTVERIRSRQNACIYAANRCGKNPLENQKKDKGILDCRVFLPESPDVLPWTRIKLRVHIRHPDDCNQSIGLLHGVLTAS